MRLFSPSFQFRLSLFLSLSFFLFLQLVPHLLLLPRIDRWMDGSQSHIRSRPISFSWISFTEWGRGEDSIFRNRSHIKGKRKGFMSSRMHQEISNDLREKKFPESSAKKASRRTAQFSSCWSQEEFRMNWQLLLHVFCYTFLRPLHEMYKRAWPNVAKRTIPSFFRVLFQVSNFTGLVSENGRIHPSIIPSYWCYFCEAETIHSLTRLTSTNSVKKSFSVFVFLRSFCKAYQSRDFILDIYGFLVASEFEILWKTEFQQRINIPGIFSPLSLFSACFTHSEESNQTSLKRKTKQRREGRREKSAALFTPINPPSSSAAEKKEGEAKESTINEEGFFFVLLRREKQN